MRAALALARRGLGRTAPNPAVGCVITDADGHVAGRGWTQPGGRPHAETEAIAHAGQRARGGTAYVTLEPCAHTGKTGSCAEALIAAGIARVVSAREDPDPRVAGRGHALLGAAGVRVDTGLCAAEATAINAGFFRVLSDRRPHVTLKLATSLDARIATHTGESRWISGPNSRDRAHLMRAQHDAILAGIGTVLADDPSLTCRLPGLAARSPLRIVADPHLRLPLTSALARTAAAVRVLVLARDDADRVRMAAFEALGIEVVTVSGDASQPLDLRHGLQELASRGITRLLCESGGRIAAALLRQDLADSLVFFRAGLVIGGEGRPAIAGTGTTALADAPRFARISVAACGEDVLETWERRR